MLTLDTPTRPAPGSIAEAARQAIQPSRPRHGGPQTIQQLLEQATRLAQAGRTADAAQLYADWLARPDATHRPLACFNRGTLLVQLGQREAAEAAYREALVLQPDFPQARINLGHQLEQGGRHDEALAEWQRVVEQGEAGRAEREMHLHALNNQIRLLEQLKRYAESEALMHRSLALDPDQGSVIQHYVHIRQKQCEWPVYQPTGRVTPNQLLQNTSLLAMHSASDDPALQLLSAWKFNQERVLPTLTPLPGPLVAAGRAPAPDRRLRLGYLSGDLGLHAVGLLTAELLELHDRERFEIHGFCWSRDDGTALQQRIRRSLDHHVRIGHLDDATAAALIARHDIDILIDLQGLTSGARPGILARRVAPVQIGWLGLPGTSAIRNVDYVLADRTVMPESLAPYFTERPLYLPNCYQPSDRQREVAQMPMRSRYGLPDDAFVYCCFNNNFKFTPEVFRSWMRVLHAVPNSVLWLLADNEWAQQNMLREADAHGVARERLIFAPRVAPGEYLARLPLADLFLDTWPYNAGTTANDVLWMGVPVLTRAGQTYISRMAASLLTHVGLPDLITETLPDYERLAITLGREPARVASYRRYLREHGRQSALFDMPRFTRDLEDTLAGLWPERNITAPSR